jgi:SAM-dependent methyltransferase
MVSGMGQARLVRIRNLLRKTIDTVKFPKNRYCCICERSIASFFPYRGGKRAPLMVALDTVGSDVKNFGCPNCGCHDRERHLLLYMKALGLIERFRGAAILHFAPERRLSEIIEAQVPQRYVKGDLHPVSESTETIDMLAIHYPAASFDFVIANHVLEHVEDDLRALSEVRRVLRAGGYAILQTPFSAKLTRTFSDPGIDSNFARYQAYGQEDHVRLYGGDIFDRITSAGFKSRVTVHEDGLADIDPLTFGVNVKEPFFLFERVDS